MKEGKEIEKKEETNEEEELKWERMKTMSWKNTGMSMEKRSW